MNCERLIGAMISALLSIIIGFIGICIIGGLLILGSILLTFCWPMLFIGFFALIYFGLVILLYKDG